MPDEILVRRNILRTIVASAVFSAAPFSLLEAATEKGHPAFIDLADGSRLKIKKIGQKQFMAVREQGGKLVDEQPTGSFTGANGEVVTLDKGKVMDVTARKKTLGTTGAMPPQAARSDWFGAFWK